jgi:aromatic-L-amino-acid/L-tryptophan decarboxylase
MRSDYAETGHMLELLKQLGPHLDKYLNFEHGDAMQGKDKWQQALGGELPEQGIGANSLIALMGEHLVPNGSAIPRPGCSAFITTGATSIGALASLAGAVASPQRIGLTAFNYLEEKSLQWLADLFELPSHMKGIYSSGGSVANILGLGAARQWAFERLGTDPARDGVQLSCRIYATDISHHTIHRAAAVLGLGRKSVISISSDDMGRMCPQALEAQLHKDAELNIVPVAIVANAGATSTGSIDPILQLAQIARKFSIWLHVDGAYGLPGILDPQVKHLYAGLELADSITVDPHKWLGAAVGIGATFVKDRNILNRAFTQGASDYLEGSLSTEGFEHSMDCLGIPYADFGLELSAPARGAIVWAMLKEIGATGMRERICRHNTMARYIAMRATQEANLQLLMQPTLSICCFRYVSSKVDDLNELNRRIHRTLVRRGENIPSTAMLNGKLAIRPCFVGARTHMQQAIDLVNEVIAIGDALTGNSSHPAECTATKPDTAIA